MSEEDFDKEKAKEQIRKKAQLDQGMALLADTFPPMWRRVYDECTKAGFDEVQSFKLLQTYILSMGTSGVNPPDA